jgi:NADPH:quinone reductase-like Zn-dependent oxidoreductase
MRQVWISQKGGPEVLVVREAPDPVPQDDELRIRVRASGVNFADIMARMGMYPDAPPLPCVVGYEVAGVVDCVGRGVEGYAAGDRVLSFTRFGGYSDVVCVPSALVRPLPDGLSFEEGAAIPVNYLTAWIMLIRLGNLQPGEAVLVHAVAGGVGQAALQIALWRGAQVIGTASASKHARLREAGVAHCIDYTRQDFEAEVKRLTKGRGVDIVIDAVGGKSFRKSYRSLAPMGRLFCFGASSAARGTRLNPLALLRTLVGMPFFHPLPLMDSNRGVFGTNMGHLWEEMGRLQCDMDQILACVREGHFRPVVDRMFSFDEAPSAHRYMQERRNFGKVLLRP